MTGDVSNLYGDIMSNQVATDLLALYISEEEEVLIPSPIHIRVSTDDISSLGQPFNIIGLLI